MMLSFPKCNPFSFHVPIKKTCLCSVEISFHMGPPQLLEAHWGFVWFSPTIIITGPVTKIISLLFPSSFVDTSQRAGLTAY